MPIHTILWKEQKLVIIDQTLLPTELKWITLDTLAAVWDAIKTLKVRGAPAIGVCAAFGVIVGIREKAPGNAAEVQQAVRESSAYLGTSRPTAVNLFWALERMGRIADSLDGTVDRDETVARLEAEAVAIFEEDKRLCRAIGEHGAELIGDGDGVLTHCNAGALATADYGTALAVMYRAHEEGRSFHVYADETRPLLQGARLTTWELMQAGIDVTLICDNTAACVMSEGKIQLVIVGADRIARNGDTANKIGTYNVAILADAHDIPFYVAAPTSTIDVTLASGGLIPIEQRGADEVRAGFGKRTAPENVNVYNPAFDVTPARLITGIITEKGILRAPFEGSIAACVGQGSEAGRAAKG